MSTELADRGPGRVGELEPRAILCPALSILKPIPVCKDYNTCQWRMQKLKRGGFQIVGEAHFSRRRRPPHKPPSLGGSGGMPPQKSFAK